VTTWTPVKFSGEWKEIGEAEERAESIMRHVTCRLNSVSHGSRDDSS
jgi:hypothetical protein